jgi:hypothetical protein
MKYLGYRSWKEDLGAHKTRTNTEVGSKETTLFTQNMKRGNSLT